MITTLHIRPLPTHPLTLPATMEIRATQDILGTASFGRVFDDPTPQMLNHPPVILMNADSGEVLLNRDTVVSQLQSNRVPNSLVVYALQGTTLDVSLRTLHFLYGQLQPLHYQKRNANGNSLADIAAHTLNTDRILYTAIAQDIFDRTTLEHRHYMVLFAAANLGARSINNLKNITGIKGKQKKKQPNTSLKKTTVVPMNITVDNKNTNAVAKTPATCGHSPQEPDVAMHPPGNHSLQIASPSIDREEHQLDLALIEEDA